MELARLIDELSRPSAYPFAVEHVEVRQTHISVVFLAGERVFKVKKPVAFGFLDFTTLAQRRHYCDEEVRLNRRLAPHVYLGVVPVTQSGSGCRFGGDGEPLDWAVEMIRLPDHATLEQHLHRGELGPEQLVRIAARIADFHRNAESGPAVSAYGRFEVVAGNARENFAQTQSQVNSTVSAEVFDRLRRYTDHHLDLLKPLIQSRADRHVPRDTHGDLHLDHVYLLPDAVPPSDVTIIDCIEFTVRFRYADPVADMAFLAMDLKDHGRFDLARDFADAYFQLAQDDEGRALLPFYLAYRSIVRAKVEGFKLAESEIPSDVRIRAMQRARGHWLLALGELSPPNERPAVLLIGGLPGSGKSTLAKHLSEQYGFAVIRSDVVRKDIAGIPTLRRAAADFRTGLYSTEMTERTYAECRRRMERSLWEGRRVIVDASFLRESWRREFLDAAATWGVPGRFVHCVADPPTIRQRLQNRRNDVSDADWTIYQQAALQWELPAADTAGASFVFKSDADGEHEFYRLNKWMSDTLDIV